MYNRINSDNNLKKNKKCRIDNVTQLVNTY